MLPRSKGSNIFLTDGLELKTAIQHDLPFGNGDQATPIRSAIMQNDIYLFSQMIEHEHLRNNGHYRLISLTNIQMSQSPLVIATMRMSKTNEKKP